MGSIGMWFWLGYWLRIITESKMINSSFRGLMGRKNGFD
jgi:hypothetical protein